MMVHDYSRRYSSVIGCRQRVIDRRVTRSSGTALGSKMVGSVICLVAVVGICASLWVNERIGAGLGEISRLVAQQNVMVEKNRQLAAGRDALLLAEAIDKKAGSLGLSHPDRSQIISMR